MGHIQGIGALLPALAGWLLDRLDDLNASLQGFITG